jgi:glycosyltransferase involved in cell wall biosynthesis
VILDIHDIVPELFTSKFGGIKQSRLFKMLLLIEQASCRFADHVIISNDLWKERIVARSVSEDKCSVCLNYPDTDIFGDWERTLSRNGTKTVLYPGTLNFHQGLDIAIEAFAEVAKMIPEAEFHIYGDGPELENLVHKVSMLGIQGKVFFKKPVPIDKIPSIMERATCGIVPKRAGGFGGQAFSTKILEFMSLGIPVLVSGTEIDHYYFNDSVVFFFESGNVADLSEKMLRMLEDENFRVGLAERAKEFVADYQWDRKQDIYLNLVDRLIFDQ